MKVALPLASAVRWVASATLVIDQAWSTARSALAVGTSRSGCCTQTSTVASSESDSFESVATTLAVLSYVVHVPGTPSNAFV